MLRLRWAPAFLATLPRLDTIGHDWREVQGSGCCQRAACGYFFPPGYVLETAHANNICCLVCFLRFHFCNQVELTAIAFSSINWAFHPPPKFLSGTCLVALHCQQELSTLLQILTDAHAVRVNQRIPAATLPNNPSVIHHTSPTCSTEDSGSRLALLPNSRSTAARARRCASFPCSFSMYEPTPTRSSRCRRWPSRSAKAR